MPRSPEKYDRDSMFSICFMLTDNRLTNYCNYNTLTLLIHGGEGNSK